MLGEEAAQVGQQISREVREVLLREQVPHSQARTEGRAPTYADEPPPPHAYNFDPLTGQPIQPPPTTGQTVNLRVDPTLPPTNLAGQSHPPLPGYPPAAPARPPRRWRWIGFVLVGFGVLVLADQIGFPTDIVFPLLMIGAGILLLRRR
jgi:phage shock protein C